MAKYRIIQDQDVFFIEKRWCGFWIPFRIGHRNYYYDNPDEAEYILKRELNRPNQVKEDENKRNRKMKSVVKYLNL